MVQMPISEGTPTREDVYGKVEVRNTHKFVIKTLVIKTSEVIWVRMEMVSGCGCRNGGGTYI